MARGWESKSVEEQQAERAAPPVLPKLPSTPEQKARWRREEGLRLARQSVLQRIEKAGDSRHRRMLEWALADLDAQLASLSRLGA
jgi:hypothetical protein